MLNRVGEIGPVCQGVLISGCPDLTGSFVCKMDLSCYDSPCLHALFFSPLLPLILGNAL